MKKVIFALLIIHCLLVIANAQWVLQSSVTEQTLRSVYFLDKHTGWTVGDGGTIFYTINSGKKWKSLKHNLITANLNSICFINGNTGWCVGDSGLIIKTINGGKKWTRQYINSFSEIHSIIFVNKHIGWIVGNNNLILKTTNAGLNWFIQTGYDSASYYSAYFINQNTGWICGSRGRIFKTTNGGENWILKADYYHDLLSICFANNLTGWAIGRVYTFMSTTDGGENWSVKSSAEKENEKSPPAENEAMFFINQNTGWYVKNHSSGNRINETIDCGLSWTTTLKIRDTAFYSIYFINPNTGWAVGDFGSIYKYFGNTYSSNANIANENILNYSLSQNYPNPFNPMTKIKYQIANDGFVSFKVFDISGREIMTLVSEQLQSGSYEVTFDGSNLSSGVYLYKLTTDGFSETKKMLLIK